MEVLKFECKEYQITISTESNFRYSWDRFYDRLKGDAYSYCTYQSSTEGELLLCDTKNQNNELISINNGVQTASWSNYWPVIFETCEYQFAVEFKNLEDNDKVSHRPKVKHVVKSLNKAFHFYPNDNNKGILVGNIDFLNFPGKFKFSFIYYDSTGTSHTESLELYVASPKLDTKKDLYEILRIIDKEYENYIFNYLTLTSGSFQLKKSERQDDLIWLSIFKNVIDEYIRNVKYILFHLNKKPIKIISYDRPDRIQIWNEQEEELFFDLGKDADLHYFRDEQIEHTIDTKENRFIKYSIKVLTQKLYEVFTNINSLYPNISESEIDEIAGYLKQLTLLKCHASLKKVGKFQGFRQESNILQQRDGYRNVYKCWLMLKNSLDIVNGKTDIGLKPIWELYEIWCFIVLKHIIANILNISDLYNSPYVNEDLNEMLDALQDKEKYHYVEFTNPNNGDLIKLEYQRVFNRTKKPICSITTIQKPDFVLSIKKSDGFILTYLFDAKYRVLDSNTSDGKCDADNFDYPVPDTLNQMHRYRDAIYYTDDSGIKREIIGSYILYPGRVTDNEYYSKYFIQSIDKINVGAFPLLPANKDQSGDIIQSDLLKLFLKKVIEQETPDHIKNSIAQKGLQY